MTVTLESYEEQFLDALTTDARIDDEYIEEIVTEIVALFEAIPDSIDPDEDVFGGDHKFQLLLMDFVPRSNHYDSQAREYLAPILDPDQPSDDIAREAIYSTAPWFAQELEGVVKHGLQAVSYAQEFNQHAGLTLPEYREKKCKYLRDAIEKVASNSGQGTALHRLVTELDPDEESEGFQQAGVKVNRLRNAIAHSDYMVNPTEHPPTVVFFDRDGSHEVSVEGFLEIFLRFQGLVRTLNVGLHLGLRRLTGQPPGNADPEELYGPPA